MPSELSDEELMMRVKAGDIEAFDTLFIRNGSTVLNFVYRLLGDYATAEDLSQECFLRVWQARHAYQPTARFRTWLLTIARRLALNELDKRRVRGEIISVIPPAEGIDELLVEVPDRSNTDNPLDVLLQKELVQMVQNAFSQLPENLREVLILREMEGLSYQEIADVTGRKVGTVKFQIHTARNRLKELVAPYVEEDG